MNIPIILIVIVLLAVAWPTWRRLHARWLLSRAKHPSLGGHVRMAKRVARLIPRYEYDEVQFFRCDDAPDAVVDLRRAGFEALARRLEARNRCSAAAMAELAPGVSDMQFVKRYRVPFQFSPLVQQRLNVGTLVTESEGVRLTDLDGNQSLDLTGAYGVNLMGYDFYKACIESAVDRVGKLGPVLGPYHPIVADNVTRLRELSGMDEVSFHMSGTEAVMQAVRLARYHSGRSHVVRFCGAYNGWWDDVQPGIGNPAPVGAVYTLREMDDATLRVLRQRRDVACVLVNPLQAMHPNSNAPGDSTLIASDRAAEVDRAAYAEWLRKLREVCTERGIALILDEVFVGFRLAYRGAQDYFGVQADMVTYGKSLGGGLPVGVVCGKHQWMRRYREDRPADICFARGTFNSHPYVMASMNEFLTRIATAPYQELYQNLDAVWEARAAELNGRLEIAAVPVRVVNLSSIFTVLYTEPSRYNWMLQFYLAAEGLTLSWVGTGRLIFSLNYSDADFTQVVDCFERAGRRMSADGWWWNGHHLTNRDLKRRVLRETLAAHPRLSPVAALVPVRSDRKARLSTDTKGTSGTATDHGMDR